MVFYSLLPKPSIGLGVGAILKQNNSLVAGDGLNHFMFFIWAVFFFFFLAAPHRVWDLSSLTMD